MTRLGGTLLGCFLILASCSSEPSLDNVAADQVAASRDASGDLEADEAAAVARELRGGAEEEQDVTPTSLSAAAPAVAAGSDAPTTEEGSGDGETSPTTTAAPNTIVPSTLASIPAVETPEDDCDAVPENCVDPGEDFSGQDLSSSVFFQSEVSGVNFSNSDLSDTDFSEAVAVGANFTGAVLTDAIIEGADLTGANFSDANLGDAFVFDSVLTRVVWSNTTCPDGTNSDDNGGTCEGTF